MYAKDADTLSGRKLLSLWFTRSDFEKSTLCTNFLVFLQKMKILSEKDSEI